MISHEDSGNPAEKSGTKPGSLSVLVRKGPHSRATMRFLVNFSQKIPLKQCGDPPIFRVEPKNCHSLPPECVILRAKG